MFKLIGIEPLIRIEDIFKGISELTIIIIIIIIIGYPIYHKINEGKQNDE